MSEENLKIPKSETCIHPSAIVDPSAEIGSGTSVGPFSVIGPKVRIGSNNTIGSHTVLEGNTTIGDNNQIYQFASVGAFPQDLKYKGEDSTLTIGNDNIIREYATLQPGTQGGGMKTSVGDGNLFMVCSHVGHDSIVGNKNIFANSATLAGHVVVGNNITFGGLSAVHQFVRVGDLSFLAGGAMVSQDVPPYCMVQGDRAELAGLNSVGMTRAGFSKEDISLIKRLYRRVFVTKDLLFTERIEQARELAGSSVVGLSLVDFIAETTRGICAVRN